MLFNDYRSASRENNRHGSIDRHRLPVSNSNTLSREKENLSWRANSNERYNRNNHNSSLERWHSNKGNNVNNTGSERQRRNSSSERQRHGVIDRQHDRRGRYCNGSRERRDRINRSRRNSNELNRDNVEELNWRNELRPSNMINRDDNRAGDISKGSDNCNPSGNTLEDHKPPGILVLPNPAINKSPSPHKDQPEVPSYPVPRGNTQRQLYNPSNPNEPILVPVNYRFALPAHKDSAGQMMALGQQNVDNRLGLISYIFVLFTSMMNHCFSFKIFVYCNCLLFFLSCM